MSNCRARSFSANKTKEVDGSLEASLLESFSAVAEIVAGQCFDGLAYTSNESQPSLNFQLLTNWGQTVQRLG
jgi:hypothetical protein